MKAGLAGNKFGVIMIKRCVSVIIFYDEKKRILLQDRREISKRGEDWGFFGGHLENDETPEEALVREIKEELDYQLDKYSFLKEVHYVTPELDITLYAFIAPLKDKLKKFNQKEGTGMKLFTLEQAKKLKMVPTDYPVLDALKQIL